MQKEPPPKVERSKRLAYTECDLANPSLWGSPNALLSLQNSLVTVPDANK